MSNIQKPIDYLINDEEVIDMFNRRRISIFIFKYVSELDKMQANTNYNYIKSADGKIIKFKPFFHNELDKNMAKLIDISYSNIKCVPEFLNNFIPQIISALYTHFNRLDGPYLDNFLNDFNDKENIVHDSFVQLLQMVDSDIEIIENLEDSDYLDCKKILQLYQ